MYTVYVRKDPVSTSVEFPAISAILELFREHAASAELDAFVHEHGEQILAFLADDRYFLQINNEIAALPSRCGLKADWEGHERFN